MDDSIAADDDLPDESCDQAWKVEAKRRLHEIRSGTVRLVPWEEAERQLFELPRPDATLPMELKRELHETQPPAIGHQGTRFIRRAAASVRTHALRMGTTRARSSTPRL